MTENERRALSQIRQYLDQGYRLDELIAAGWREWIDYFHSEGIDLKVAESGPPPPAFAVPSSVRNEANEDSFFWQTVWTVMAVSNIVRWPIGLLIFFGGAVALFWEGYIFWGVLWLLILGELVTGLAMLVIAVPFFILGVLFGWVLTATRWLWRREKAAFPFEVRRR